MQYHQYPQAPIVAPVMAMQQPTYYQPVIRPVLYAAQPMQPMQIHDTRPVSVVDMQPMNPARAHSFVNARPVSLAGSQANRSPKLKLLEEVDMEQEEPQTTAKKVKKVKEPVPPCKACFCCCCWSIILLLCVAILTIFSVIATPPKMAELDTPIPDLTALVLQVPYGTLDFHYVLETGEEPYIRAAFPYLAGSVTQGVYTNALPDFLVTVLSYMNPDEQDWHVYLPVDASLGDIEVYQTVDTHALEVDVSAPAGQTVTFGSLDLVGELNSGSELVHEGVTIVS
eukprot:gnl/Dysnectes_brevis/2570_a3096_1453.p1 GENE.gnl/Dysnectes_brevis/2570_a3096_1453~~gnl/Dysnectes_brevis/2570_a3096_1453.p1  ORF type:complete len:283 (+),score=67.17 gnl/Dysnectes_brevis/2570_a3096_1453:818-1666(+)